MGLRFRVFGVLGFVRLGPRLGFFFGVWVSESRALAVLDLGL